VRTASFAAVAALVMVIFVLSSPGAEAYDRYNDGCNNCHGAFTDDTSTKGSVFPSDNKHVMHRASSNMNTDCSLCHTSSDNRDPFIGSSDGTNDTPGMGCIGCHVAPGLRAHHADANVAICAPCHQSDPTPDPENVNPPYYGSVDTDANNACNLVATAGTNENWTVGDTLGLDNDGDGLYDGNDPDCGGSVETPGETLDILVVGHDTAGQTLSITYDNTTCATTANNFYFGLLSQVSTHNYTGQDCSLGNTGSYTFNYTGITDSLFFLIAGHDMLTEGSYGTFGAASAERPEAGLCVQTQNLTDRCDTAAP